MNENIFEWGVKQALNKQSISQTEESEGSKAVTFCNISRQRNFTAAVAQFGRAFAPQACDQGSIPLSRQI